jgi:glycosyltransferase involved in cell wall biosynthesis
VSTSRDDARLRVVIDARLESGLSGGVEGVVIGLAAGLSALEGPEDYVFVTREGHDDWLRPHLAGPTRIAIAPRAGPPLTSSGRLRKRLGDAAPAVREAWHRIQRKVGAPSGPQRNLFVERLEPQVVHQPIQNGFLTTVPAIFHPHDLQHVHLPEFFTPKQRAFRERWYGTLCRQAAMVAVATEWTRADVAEHYRLPPGRVRVVPLAPLLAPTRTQSARERADTLARLGISGQYVLYPAQTWPHKNHIRLLEALALLRDERRLVIPLVASGRQNEHFADIAAVSRRLGLDDQVVWTGFVSPLDLRTLYLEARGVVIPSLFEAASGPLWEAFESGIPAACSDVTSLPDQAGDAALIFDPLNVHDMADAIARLWTDDDLRRRLVERGRERVAALSWPRTARIFRAHYRRLAGFDLGAEDRSLIGPEP